MNKKSIFFFNPFVDKSKTSNKNPLFPSRLKNEILIKMLKLQKPNRLNCKKTKFIQKYKIKTKTKKNFDQY